MGQPPNQACTDTDCSRPTVPPRSSCDVTSPEISAKAADIADVGSQKLESAGSS
ncbi:hypothetical protein [Mycobacterium kiyosense]|uniref:hypothetical protein n=1 Tax=Mycobacterium kiyosense TaxID=2871094 RepID=UPI00222FB418|nr:hypothetical protein [Mycobacterium kiyosense]